MIVSTIKYCMINFCVLLSPMHAFLGTASLRPSFVCCDESETFPLELLRNGAAQCSNNHVSEETTLHCEGIIINIMLYDDEYAPRATMYAASSAQVRLLIELT